MLKLSRESINLSLFSIAIVAIMLITLSTDNAMYIYPLSLVVTLLYNSFAKHYTQSIVSYLVTNIFVIISCIFTMASSFASGYTIIVISMIVMFTVHLGILAYHAYVYIKNDLV